MIHRLINETCDIFYRIYDIGETDNDQDNVFL